MHDEEEKQMINIDCSLLQRLLVFVRGTDVLVFLSAHVLLELPPL